MPFEPGSCGAAQRPATTPTAAARSIYHISLKASAQQMSIKKAAAQQLWLDNSHVRTAKSESQTSKNSTG
jgi:hypothetical protein